MRLVYRLVIGFAVLLLLLVATGAVTYVIGRGVAAEARYAKEESAVFAGLARAMKLDAIQIQQFLSDISATRALDGLADGFAKADESRASFLKGLAQFREMYRREQDREQLRKLDELEARLAAYHTLGTRMAQAYIADGPAGGNKHMAAFDKAAEDLSGALDPFVDEQVGELNEKMEAIVASAERLSRVTWLVALAGTVFGVACAWLVTRSITVPMTAAVAAMQDIAEGEGDLTARLDAARQDEIGQMAAAFNRFVAHIEEVVRRVVGTAQHVASAAQQLSGASEQLAAGAQEQAASLEETAASLEEITSTVRQNADSARHASELAGVSHDTAKKGVPVLENAVAGMAEINQASHRIAEITATIDEIAFQTNLLALNAAVEAARAGEEGRGFAVVASEVRNLAQRSAAAAKDVRSLIQDSVGKVEAGSTLVNASGGTLGDIVVAVKRVTEIIAEIAAASAQQSTGVEQVNTAITQMEQVVNSNTAQTEELSSTAQSLAREAAALQTLVGRFKVAEDDAAPRSVASRVPALR